MEFTNKQLCVAFSALRPNSYYILRENENGSTTVTWMDPDLQIPSEQEISDYLGSL